MPTVTDLEALTDEEIVKLAADPFWRIRNLYRVIDKDGQDVLFVPWPEQEALIKGLWYRNLILKARQRGFCLHPDTRVLTADLRWVRIDDIDVGTEIVATDECVPGGRGLSRKMRRATIEAKVERLDRTYRITFDDGRTVICTGQHRWLSRPSEGVVGNEWRSIENGSKKKLRVGSLVRSITRSTWGEGSYEDGWFGGLLDGEGSIRVRDIGGIELSVNQVPGAVLDRARRYLTERGYTFREEIDDRAASTNGRGKLGKKAVHKLVLNRTDEAFRLIGTCQTSRIANTFWQDRDLPGKKSGTGWAKIVSIEPLGVERVIDLQTSAKTFIAEGFVSHNSTVIQLLMLDTCIFIENTNAAVIAQDQDAATVIFRKIKFAYEKLPPVIQQMAPLARDSASELILGNNSSLRVATSARSATLQFLHVSEFGKICAKFPDKAREIVTGSLPAVAQTGVCFIESTAEGREGQFYDMSQTAQKNAQTGKVLSVREYKFHFASWWDAAEYETDPEFVAITGKEHDYFNKIENVIGREISLPKRAWYIATRDNEFGGDNHMMRQEYPSTPDEAFEQSTEGVYYAEQMAAARRQGRICDLPHDPSLPVNTFWDLGRNDDNAIWFHQKVGPWDHFIDFYEVSDAPFSTITNHMQSLGYTWGRHYLPHDGKHRSYGIEQLQTPRDMLEALGLRNIEIVPQTPNVTIAIRQCRDAFPKYRFDQTRCKPGLNHIDHYRKRWNDRLGTWADEPLKNGHQHAADALRQHAQMFTEPHITAGSRRKRRPSGMAA